MAKGFRNFLKKAHKFEQETNDKNNENYINRNPTEEQLKDNKNGTIAVIFSVISCVLLIAIIAIIVTIFSSNVGMGLLSVALLIIPASLQKIAVKKAKKQLNINGNGKTKLLLVKFVFPTIAAIVSVIIIFVLIGTFLK